MAVALLVAVIVSLASSGPRSGAGCVSAVFPGPVGAEQIHRCGGAARQLCASLRSRQGYAGEAARTISVECRKAGLSAG